VAEDHNDVAEIAAASALRLSDVVIAPSFAAGARLARADAHSPVANSGSLLAVSFASAVESLCSSPKDAVALISGGPLRDLRHWRTELAFASRHKLPLLVLALTHPHAGSPDLRTLYSEIALPVITVDAHDAIAVYRVATEAAHNSRLGRGPTLIEAACIDHSRAGMTSPEPLASLESYMRRHGAWNDDLRES
jgi:TPP-dependent pyruvate/acetoin dehydrogenase alpha subunit